MKEKKELSTSQTFSEKPSVMKIFDRLCELEGRSRSSYISYLIKQELLSKRQLLKLSEHEGNI